MENRNRMPAGFCSARSSAFSSLSQPEEGGTAGRAGGTAFARKRGAEPVERVQHTHGNTRRQVSCVALHALVERGVEKARILELGRECIRRDEFAHLAHARGA